MSKAQHEGPGQPRSPYAYLGLGFEIAVPVVLCMYAGHKLDVWLDSQPWLFLLGAFSGMAVGFYNLFRRTGGPPGGGRGEGR